MPSLRYLDALEYAAILHREQTRKGSNVPYISHLVAVSMIALEYGADEDVAIAGLLHDAVEDQGGLPILEAIRERYGDRVAEIVRACSDSVANTLEGEAKLPWVTRKLSYIKHIQQGTNADRDAQLVSASDKLHNLLCILRDYRNIGGDLWERFRAGREGVLWYYRELIAAFESAHLIPLSLLERLQQTYQELSHAVEKKEGLVLPSGYMPVA
ncbi:HD domain-containing protein [uncultured Thermosynechococcus sp.]|uniref:HD domain-containing protein n=1 Tax=uncultured Thermosynechococcus sp. TaxID=436945 RepID=UPI002625911C|nr:HD domain-containing protein [uncultured Thermosynechococcus sp.]